MDDAAAEARHVRNVSNHDTWPADLCPRTSSSHLWSSSNLSILNHVDESLSQASPCRQERNMSCWSVDSDDASDESEAMPGWPDGLTTPTQSSFSLVKITLTPQESVTPTRPEFRPRTTTATVRLESSQKLNNRSTDCSTPMVASATDESGFCFNWAASSDSPFPSPGSPCAASLGPLAGVIEDATQNHKKAKNLHAQFHKTTLSHASDSGYESGSASPRSPSAPSFSQTRTAENKIPTRAAKHVRNTSNRKLEIGKDRSLPMTNMGFPGICGGPKMPLLTPPPNFSLQTLCSKNHFYRKRSSSGTKTTDINEVGVSSTAHLSKDLFVSSRGTDKLTPLQFSHFPTTRITDVLREDRSPTSPQTLPQRHPSRRRAKILSPVECKALTAATDYFKYQKKAQASPPPNTPCLQATKIHVHKISLTQERPRLVTLLKGKETVTAL